MSTLILPTDYERMRMTDTHRPDPEQVARDIHDTLKENSRLQFERHPLQDRQM